MPQFSEHGKERLSGGGEANALDMGKRDERLSRGGGNECPEH